VKLPPGRALIPGVITHKTTVLQHPEIAWAKLEALADGAALASRLW